MSDTDHRPPTQTVAATTRRRRLALALLGLILGLGLAVASSGAPASARPLSSGGYARAGLAYGGRTLGLYTPQPALPTGASQEIQLVRPPRDPAHVLPPQLRRLRPRRNIETYRYVCIVRIEPGEADDLLGRVTETSDGLRYAYTQMVNKLNGRPANASAICSGRFVAETGWF